MSVAPVFQAGQVDGVSSYLREAVYELCRRLNSDDSSALLQKYFQQALEINIRRMQNCLEAPTVEAAHESRLVLDMLADLLISDASQMFGHEYLEEALAWTRKGGNVLLVSNHSSGADSMVLDFMVNKYFRQAAQSWWYMSGHVVNLFLLPLTVSSAFNRVQIFSVKYCQLADANSRSRMTRNNHRALMSIGPLLNGGGKVIVLYPEGGRGEGQLKTGDSSTMKIPQLMAMASDKELMVLPSYVESSQILPVKRGVNEFNEFLAHASYGQAILKFGKPMLWGKIQPDTQTVMGWMKDHHEVCSGRADRALLHCLIKQVMSLVAELTPAGHRGLYER